MGPYNIFNDIKLLKCFCGLTSKNGKVQEIADGGSNIYISYKESTSMDFISLSISASFSDLAAKGSPGTLS